LSYNSIETIDSKFAIPGRPGSITFDLHIIIPILIYNMEDKDKPKIPSNMLCNYYVPYRLESHVWLGWLRTWGYAMKLVIMPEELYIKTHELMKQLGYIKEWEVFSKGIELLRSASPPIVSVKRSNSLDTGLRDAIKNLICDARRILYIAVQMLDNYYMNEILEAIDRDVDVRIIIGKYDENWLKNSRDRKGIAINELSKKVQIKLKSDFHGRMIIADDTLLVGSLDLDNQGITTHDNVSIQTTEATALQRSKEIFCQLEEESKNLEFPKK
jgi:hypothetical protein